MPKVKPLGVKPVKKKVLTKLQKAEARAKIMVANEKKAIDAEKQTRFQQCVEVKLLKGHSQELAEKMAREIIYNTHEV
tara:strand:+ start:329 stop:562 length:234 start_codon:yes stop_codon:yes gene_type:complete